MTGIEYYLHEGRGTNGENCYLIFPDGPTSDPITAYINPAVGIEASLADILDPPVPPPPPVIIPYGVFRSRWTDDELDGLFSTRKTSWRVDDYIGLAQAQNSVNLSGPTAAAAQALFVKLGVLTAERAAAIFAID